MRSSPALEKCKANLANIYVLKDGPLLRPSIHPQWIKRVLAVEQRLTSHERTEWRETDDGVFRRDKDMAWEELDLFMRDDLLLWDGVDEVLPLVPLYCGRHRRCLVPLSPLVKSLRGPRKTQVLRDAVLKFG